MRGDVWRHIEPRSDASNNGGNGTEQEENKGKDEKALQEYEANHHDRGRPGSQRQTKARLAKISDELPGKAGTFSRAARRGARNKNMADAKTAIDEPSRGSPDNRSRSQSGEWRKGRCRIAANLQQPVWVLGITLALCFLGGAGAAFVVIRSCGRSTPAAQRGQRAYRRRRAGGQRGRADFFFQPVAGARRFRTGGIARGDLGVERGD